MNKDALFYGIDISKDVFDVIDEKGIHYQFKNNYSGFKKYLKLLDNHCHCVMEATGYYHYKLAYFLFENNIKVSEENPLSVKRYIQMKLSKIKTDKSDARMICAYAKKCRFTFMERTFSITTRMFSNDSSPECLHETSNSIKE